MALPAHARAVRGSAPEGHRSARKQPVEPREAQGELPVCGLRTAPFQFGHEIRQWYRLAQFLQHAAGGGGHEDGLHAHMAPHRIPLRALRRAPGPRLRRRSGAHGRHGRPPGIASSATPVRRIAPRSSWTDPGSARRPQGKAFGSIRQACIGVAARNARCARSRGLRRGAGAAARSAAARR